ncbi:MAG TPA: hypothetical protein VMU81_14330 [Acetobacteraceae bacterium]|nr:hypothetical protein [Acetobacteraceae bacterium]
MQSTDRRNSGQLYTILFQTVAAALAISVVITASLRLADALRPQNGDIIAFVPSTGGGVSIEATLVARRAGRSRSAFCILDPKVMQQSGGSLVIEAANLGGIHGYRVHWAGGRTSAGADCGQSANLLLTPDDIAELLLAANTANSAANYNNPGIGRRAR